MAQGVSHDPTVEVACCCAHHSVVAVAVAGLGAGAELWGFQMALWALACQHASLPACLC
jgi:hypothetical protein